MIKIERDSLEGSGRDETQTVILFVFASGLRMRKLSLWARSSHSEVFAFASRPLLLIRVRRRWLPPSLPPRIQLTSP